MKKSEILAAFHFRHACKQFDPNQKITEADFTTILEAARLSPSSFGLEPWKFLVIQDKKLRKILHENFWGSRTDAGQIPSCSHFIIALARKNVHFDGEYVKNILTNVHKFPPEMVTMRTEFVEGHQKNDFDLLNIERNLYDWATHQTYIALGNMLTAAALLGIDSCPLEGFHKDNMNQVLARHLDINLEEVGIAYAATFGFRKNDQPKKTRNKLEDVVEWF